MATQTPTPVPWLLSFIGGWGSILAQLDNVAESRGCWSYGARPTQWRFSGWGTVGFPPRLACNVYYFTESGEMIDLGRFSG